MNKTCLKTEICFLCRFADLVIFVKELYWLLESYSPILSIHIPRNFMGIMEKCVFIKRDTNKNIKKTIIYMNAI